MTKTEHDPNKNYKAISIIQQEDGNYKAWMTKYGKVIEIRAGDPMTALQMLLTSDA